MGSGPSGNDKSHWHQVTHIIMHIIAKFQQSNLKLLFVLKRNNSTMEIICFNIEVPQLTTYDWIITTSSPKLDNLTLCVCVHVNSWNTF